MSMQISRPNVFAWMALVIVLFGRNELHAFTAADAQTTFTAYTRTFYCNENTNGYFRASTAGGKSSFWERAEQMEMLLDVYERTTNADCSTMFNNVFNGFRSEHGLDCPPATMCRTSPFLRNAWEFRPSLSCQSII